MKKYVNPQIFVVKVDIPYSILTVSGEISDQTVTPVDPDTGGGIFDQGSGTSNTGE